MGYSPDAIQAIYPIMEKHESSTQRGGIFANKTGYHNSRNGNSRYDYSVQCPADRDGDPNAAAAIDITLSDAAMKRVTKRLFDACRKNDPRMYCVREVIGTLDGRNVDVYNRVATGNGSRSRTGNIGAASDRSHMWHVHISFLRRYVNDEQAMLGVAEVAAGVKAGTYTSGKTVTPEKPKHAKPSAPKGKNAGKKVKRYTKVWGAKGWDSKKAGVVKHVRPRGFKVNGTIVERSDGQYVRTAWGTDYPVDELSSKKQNIPAKRKGVSLAAIVAAAKRDPKKPQGFKTSATEDDVRMIEAALQAEGFLSSKYSKDGSFGSTTVEAYSKWQKKLGYRGKDANGIPGWTSLKKLAKKYGFKAQKHD